METKKERGRNRSIDLTFISRGSEIGEDVDDEDDDVGKDEDDGR